MSNSSSPPNLPKASSDLDADSDQDVLQKKQRFREEKEIDYEAIILAAGDFDVEWSNPQREKDIEDLESYRDELKRQERDREMRLAAAGRTAPFTNEQTLLEIEQKFKDVEHEKIQLENLLAITHREYLTFIDNTVESRCEAHKKVIKELGDHLRGAMDTIKFLKGELDRRLRE